MVDPTSATYVPHIMGITLDGTGVANTQVVATNQSTGDTLIRETDDNKRVIFDAANFTSGYSADDIIEFENVGASFGGSTITITNDKGGFQEAEIACAAAGTTQRVI